MQFGVILAYIGLACTCILIVALAIIAIVDFRSINRVTIRLVVGLAIADLMSHLTSILVIGTAPLIGKPYCQGLAAISTFSRHLYAFTNIAISYHLYRAIVQLKKPSFKSELVVWIILVVVIAVIMIIYHFLGVFSGTKNKHACNPGADNPVITKVVFGLIGLSNILAIVSGLYVTIVGHRYLGKWIETYFDKNMTDPKDQSQLKEAKLKSTKRSFLYPLSSLITLTAEVVLCVWMVITIPPSEMYVVSSTMIGFKGILTLITFFLDQAVLNTAKATYSKLTDIQMNNI